MTTAPIRKLVALMVTQNRSENSASGPLDVQTYRNLFQSCTMGNQGEILQFSGKETLSVFPRAEDALRCALSLQEKFKGEIPVGIALHFGEMVRNREELYGDGVMLVRRIGGLAPVGGILTSGIVLDELKGEDNPPNTFLGNFSFPEIPRPLRIHSLRGRGIEMPETATIREWEQKYPLEPSSQGVDRLLDSPPGKSPFRWSAVGLAFLGIALLTAWWLGAFERQDVMSPKPKAHISGEPSTLAVLPFSDKSPHEENEYFSDGITEDILTLLAKIEGLRVISRTSVMQYKDSDKSITEIGEELNADHILEGSVEKEGGRVRIIAHLIDARQDKAVWEETYDHEMEDIFAVQSQVARDIAHALRTELTAETELKLSSIPQANISAYELYLKGRRKYLEYDPEANIEGIELFREALRIDSNYALAWAGLGDALAQHGVRYFYGKEYLDSARMASERAIALNPKASEGYKALGLVFHYEGNLESAIRQYRKAIELNPSNDMATNNLSSSNMELGNIAESIVWGHRTLEINPTAALTMTNLGQGYMLLGRFGQARYWIEKALRCENQEIYEAHELMCFLDLLEGDVTAAIEQSEELRSEYPDLPKGYETQGTLNLFQQNYTEAERWIRQADSVMKLEDGEKNNIYYATAIGICKMNTGREKEGRRELKEQIARLEKETKSKKTVWQMNIYEQLSYCHAALGETEKALEYLDTYAEYRWQHFYFLTENPLLKNIMDTPRYEEIMLKAEESVRKHNQELDNLMKARKPLNYGITS